MIEKDKELYVERIITYEEKLGNKRYITLCSWTVAVASLGVVVTATLNNLTTGNDALPMLMGMGIAMGASLTGSLVGLVTEIAKRAKLKGRIEEIKELLKHHGFDPDEELARSKGK